MYMLSDDFQTVQLLRKDFESEITERLTVIEKEITQEYLKKQEGKLGIKNLGNEIRYNSTLKTEFTTLKNNKLIIKMTENRRSFIKVFLDNWIAHNSSELYYFILESSFGNESKIVDGSFIRMNEINEELRKFFSFFKKTTPGPKVHFIEMKGFTKYHIIDNEGFTCIQLNN